MAPLGLGLSMTLQHTREVAQADWWAAAAVHWTTLVELGPPGFDAYCQVSFPVGDIWRPETEVFSDLAEVLARHTADGGQDCRFGLWDGWGDIDGGDAVGMLSAISDSGKWFTRMFGKPVAPQVPPAFSPAIMSAPRVAIGARQYLLFRGPLEQAGEWGARPLAVDWPARQISIPNLTWPADRSWAVASDADPNTMGIGGSRALIDAICLHPRLDARVVGYPVSPGRSGASGWDS